MGDESINKENFIDSLVLPAGIQPKHFEGMNRYHFKYYGDGFVVLDLQNNYYHLRAKEEYLRGVFVFDYEIDKNHPSKPATVRCIPYNNTDVFYRLVSYITHGKIYDPQEISDINRPMRPKSKVRKPDGTVKYTCGRCNTAFISSPRCPECGQVVKE